MTEGFSFRNPWAVDVLILEWASEQGEPSWCLEDPPPSVGSSKDPKKTKKFLEFMMFSAQIQIHPSYLYMPAYPVQGHGGVEAYHSGHWVRQTAFQMDVSVPNVSFPPLQSFSHPEQAVRSICNR